MPVEAMYRFSWLPFFVLALFGLLTVTGCRTPHGQESPLSRNYAEVAYPRRGEDADFARVALEFHPPGGPKQTLWPQLYGVNEVVLDDLVIFVGDVSSHRRGNTQPRLFLVQAPQVPVDVTDEMLWRWSRANHRNLDQALQHYSLVTPVRVGAEVELRFDFWTDEGENDWPEHGVLRLPVGQMPEILRSAQKRAHPEREPTWHTDYLRE